MTTSRCGIWIDNAEAILVRLSDDGAAEIQRIESGVSSRAKTVGGMRGGGAGHISGASHKKAERKRQNQIAHFYSEVWGAIQDAASIAILGPGPARTGLVSEIRSHHGHPEVVVVEPDQRQTDPQLVARFRTIFDVPVPS